MRLENFHLEPRREEGGDYRDENFDFESSDWVTEATQPVSEHAIDPSGIGRKVILEFTGSGVPKTYTESDYLDEQGETDQYYSKFETDSDRQDKLAEGIQEIFDDLYTDGITSTLIEGKMTIYGTSGDDQIEGSVTTRGYDIQDETDAVRILGIPVETFQLPQHKDASNGLAYVAGAGADQITGTEYDDILIGGDDGDTLYGSGGNDILIGGSREGWESTGSAPTNAGLAWNDDAGDILVGGAGDDQYFVGARGVKDNGNYKTERLTHTGDERTFNESLYDYVDMIIDHRGNDSITVTISGLVRGSHMAIAA